MLNLNSIIITPDMLRKIVEIDTFNSSWAGQASRLTSAELKSIKRVATIESVGSSNRIEGNKMSDAQVEELFSHIDQKSFRSRDEEEVAGYADLERIRGLCTMVNFFHYLFAKTETPSRSQSSNLKPSASGQIIRKGPEYSFLIRRTQCIGNVEHRLCS